MIEFEDVSLSLGNFALKNCSLSIGEGEYFVIMGPSGAGKTILLELIAGLHDSDTGVIRINGSDAAEIPVEKRGIAIVYQDYALFPHMTVEANICYGMQRRHIPRDEQMRRCRELAGSFGIAHLLKRKPLTLSGGEAQRAALCRALAVKPSILLLDEPYSALDNESRKSCIADLKKLHKEGLTVVHVTHSLEEAKSLAMRVAIIRDGQIVVTGDAEEVFTQPKDEATARFLGFENIFRGDVIGRRGRVCIRREDILLHPEECENSFPGNVLSADIQGALRICTVDIGEVLTVTLGKREGDYLAGSRVFVEIPDSAVHMI
jgi:molybdate/tungstate transport system ATP-binding protein